MNSWILRKDLERLTKKAGVLGEWARTILKHDQYPVCSLVINPTGRLRSRVPANDLIGSEEGMAAGYARFLNQGRTR